MLKKVFSFIIISICTISILSTVTVQAEETYSYYDNFIMELFKGNKEYSVVDLENKNHTSEFINDNLSLFESKSYDKIENNLENKELFIIREFTDEDIFQTRGNVKVVNYHWQSDVPLYYNYNGKRGAELLLQVNVSASYDLSTGRVVTPLYNVSYTPIGFHDTLTIYNISSTKSVINNGYTCSYKNNGFDSYRGSMNQWETKFKRAYFPDFTFVPAGI